MVHPSRERGHTPRVCSLWLRVRRDSPAGVWWNGRVWEIQQRPLRAPGNGPWSHGQGVGRVTQECEEAKGTAQGAVQAPRRPGPSHCSQTPTLAWPAPSYMINGWGPKGRLIPDSITES